MLTVFFPFIIAFGSWVSDVGQLSDTLEAAYPKKFKHQSALLHAIAAKLAENKDVPAELLLSVARVESGYDSKTVSAPIKDCAAYLKRTGKECYYGRRIGTWQKDVPGNDWVPAGKIYWKNGKKKRTAYFCGISQATAYSWQQCLELRDIFKSYESTSRQLRKWNKHCRGRFRCMLLGYGGGVIAIANNTSKYPTKVVSRRKELRTARDGLTSL